MHMNKLFFISHLAVLRPTVSYFRGDRLTHLISTTIICLLQFQTQVLRKPQGEAGSISSAEYPVKFDQQPSDSSNNALTHEVVYYFYFTI